MARVTSSRITTSPTGTTASTSPRTATRTARPTPSPIALPVSIDFYNNDFSNMADNCIEADGGARNIRVFRNRCFNSAQGAFSAQPIFGGPVYFYQNLVYDATTGGPLKFIDTPAGVLVYQNTFIGQGRLMRPASNVHFLNNLILGRRLRGSRLRLTHLHQLLDFGLQRLPPEPRRQQLIRMGLAALRGRGRLSARSDRPVISNRSRNTAKPRTRTSTAS